MAAAATDLLKKLAKRWVGQIGSGGVTDGVITTIPLSSVTNLPTDTAVVATIDRVDANGSPTPNKEESVTGVVSGSNLTSSVRGVEGTAQAHDAGAVVEILVTAKGYNDIIDAFLVAHTQLGAHKSGLTLTSPVLDGSLTGTGILDEDDMTSNSATKVPTQQSVKAYVDAHGATFDDPDIDNAGGSSTTSSTYANITGADVAVTTTIPSNILLIATIQCYANPGAVSGSVDHEFIWHDGTTTIGTSLGVSHQPSNVRKTITLSHIVVGPTVGAHTYTVQHKSSNNTLSVTAEAINCLAIPIPS